MPLFEPPNVEKMKSKGNVRGLVKALSYQQDQAIRQAAAEALGEMSDQQAVEPLIAALIDDDRRVITEAAKALKNIGAPAVEPLIAALKDLNYLIRMRAAHALGLVGDVRAVEPLCTALIDEEPNVRLTATDALEKLGWQPDRSKAGAAFWFSRGQWDRCAEIGAPAVEPLITILKVSRKVACQGIRMRAAQILGQLGDAQAMEPLYAALKDDAKEVRGAAVEALDRLGWKPDEGKAGAAYWTAKREKDRGGILRQVAAPSLTLASLRAEFDAAKGVDGVFSFVRDHSESDVERICAHYPLDDILSGIARNNIQQLHRLDRVTTLAALLVNYESVLRDRPQLRLPANLNHTHLADTLVSRLSTFIDQLRGLPPSTLAPSVSQCLYDTGQSLMESRPRDALQYFEISRTMPSGRPDYDLMLCSCHFNIAQQEKDPDAINEGIRLAQSIVAGDLEVSPSGRELAQKMLEDLERLRAEVNIE